MKKNLFLLAILTCTIHGIAQPGRLDSAFGVNGIQKTIFTKGNILSEAGKKLFRQSDGKILAVFTTNIDRVMIARFLANGTPDVSYGKGGFSKEINISYQSAAMQPNGKIVLVGSYYNGSDADYAVVRVLTNGNPDSAFGQYGMKTLDFGNYESANGVAIQTDGKIVTVGAVNDDFAIVRFTSSGGLDNSFSGDGRQMTDFGFYEAALDVAIQTDGKIVVGGQLSSGFREVTDFAVARYTTTGLPDNSFSGDGKQTVDFGFDDIFSALLIQPDGKIVMTGTAFINNDIASEGDFGIARLNANGTPDNTFSGDGKQTTNIEKHDAAFAVTRQTDGKLIVAGLSTGVNQNFTMVRYTANGIPDVTFSGDGKQTTNPGENDIAFAVMVQPDGKILIAGEAGSANDSDLGLVRYNSNGTPDNIFSADGLATLYFPIDLPLTYRGAAVQADGKLVVAGSITQRIPGTPGFSDFAVARYLANGTLDNTFSQDGKVTTSFDGNDEGSAVVIQADGKIVVAGVSSGRFALARYKTDGTPDNTFSNDGRVVSTWPTQTTVSSVAIQADGKIVVAGSIIEGTTDNSNFALARYNTNGSLDLTFSDDGRTITEIGANDLVSSLAIQKDGKILAVGSSTDNNTAETYFALARYNTNGVLDNSFSGDGKQVKNFLLGWVNRAKAVALQGDGKIVVTGTYADELTTSFLVARYKTDGTLDNTYSGDGLLLIDFPNQDEPNAIVIQADGKAVIGGYANSQEQFALARVRTDGTLDPAFGNGGKQTISLLPERATINSFAISQHRLYAAGNADYAFPSKGVVAAFQLGAFAVNLTCPPSKTVPPDAGKCVATVKNIDAVVSPLTGAYTILYTLSGATTGSGTGTASNRGFNTGVTKVTYKIAEAPEKTCSFNITVSKCAAASLTPGATGLSASVLSNPTAASFTVSTSSKMEGSVLLRITDAMGRLIEQRNIPAIGSMAIGHSYRPGIYYILVTQGQEKVALRAIKR